MMRGTGTGMAANNSAVLTNGSDAYVNGAAETASTNVSPCAGSTRK